MQWNPFLNAIGAATYIGAVGLLVNYISKLHHDTPDNLVGSLAFISLLVLSVAMMAFFFFYRPLALLLEGKKDEALSYFLKTVGIFALITLLVISTIL